MNRIFKADSIHTYNNWAGVETQHPLVGIIDFSTVQPLPNTRKLYGFYAIFLKDQKCGELRYGRQYYDYQEGTLLFLSPGQVFGAEPDGQVIQPSGYLLMFHPDFLLNTPLSRITKEYKFFSYDINEALHLSQQERETIMDCIRKIQAELQHPVDKHSKNLIIDNLKMFLDYCNRYYDRQFIIREHVNKDILVRFEQLLDTYFTGGKAEANGLPTVQYCAAELHLSANYLSDLLRKETGSTALRYIHSKIIDLAKNEIATTNKTINEIAYRLGFQYSQHFTRLFKKEVGCSPVEFRRTQQA